MRRQLYHRNTVRHTVVYLPILVGKALVVICRVLANSHNVGSGGLDSSDSASLRVGTIAALRPTILSVIVALKEASEGLTPSPEEGKAGTALSTRLGDLNLLFGHCS